MRKLILFVICSFVGSALFAINMANSIPNLVENGYKIMYVWNNGHKTGVLKEKTERRHGYIFFKKKAIYFEGKNLFYNLKITEDFTSYSGTISANGKEWIKIVNDRLTVFSDKSKKEYTFENGVLPSCLLHLYIHRLLKNRRPIPQSLRFYYENTGDVLTTYIKASKRFDHYKIEFTMDSINMKVEEIYYPVNDAYSVQSGSLYILDKRFGNQINNYISSDSQALRKIVHVPDSFTGFAGKKKIIYTIKLPQSFAFPKNSCQEVNGPVHGKYGLEICACDYVLDNSSYGEYSGYTASFFDQDKIDDLSRRVTQNSSAKDAKIAEIMAWISRNISSEDYECIEPYMVVKKKKGECQGHSNLFLAMCSTHNIHGRAVVGVLIRKNIQNEYTYEFHQWAEIWDKNKWIPYDPSFNRKGIGANYITLIHLKKRIDLLSLMSIKDKLEIEVKKEEDL